MDASTCSSVLETSASSPSSTPPKCQEKPSIRTLVEHSNGKKTEEDLEEKVTVVKSLCVNCRKKGTTFLFLHKLHQLQQATVSSFECSFCGFEDNNVKTAGELSSEGSEITLIIKNKKDFNRIVAKSDHATFKLVEFDFEIPAATQKGKCSTLEEIFKQAIKEYEEKLNALAEENEKKKCEGLVEKLQGALQGNQFPLTVKIDDPSGTSFIQSKSGLKLDRQIRTRFYKRPKEKTEAMGYCGTSRSIAVAADKPKHDIPVKLQCYSWNLDADVEQNLRHREEVKTREIGAGTIILDVECSHCGATAVNTICEVEIPGFRKCLLMSFVCDTCGERDAEIKPTGPYGEKARRWELCVASKDDLKRDVLKSEEAGVSIPSIEFEMLPGTLGGVFTSVGTLLHQAADNLKLSIPFSFGNSIQIIVDKLKALAQDPAELPFTLILDDAADQSFIGKRHTASESDTADANLKNEEYERTPKQNDELGLSDMVVEDY